MEFVNDLKFCRLCLIQQKEYSNIRFVQIFNNSLLADKLYKCTSLKISTEDSILRYICCNCDDLLTKFDEFIDMCRRSETLLTKKYKKSLATGHDVEKSVLNKEVISEYNRYPDIKKC
jgi:hypothetical protein